jgi:nicotinamide-nucleotide amidase
MIDDALQAQATAVLAAFRVRSWTIGTAESCTGGLIAGTLTEIAGSSDVVEGGFVTYSNAVKAQSLGVPAELIARLGAVSREVAIAMAEGVLAKLPTVTVAIAVTGVAGPGGGSVEKPVGLVHFGLARRGAETVSWHEVFAGDRSAIRRATVQNALARLAGVAGAAPVPAP